MVSALESGGTLADYLQERHNRLKEERVREICNAIAQALDFMHDYGLLHGEIDL
jgi:serine/threonine protein kinase